MSYLYLRQEPRLGYFGQPAGPVLQNLIGPTPISSAKGENEKLLNPFLGAVSPQNALKRAGLKTTKWIDRKTVPLIQSALEQSPVLKPFISAKLKSIPITKNFVFHGSDEEFNYAYTKLSKIVIPSGSKEDKELLNIRGFYHHPTDSIHLRSRSTVGLALRLAIRKLSSPAFQNFFGKSLDEGLSLHFANLVLAEQGLEQMMPEQYRDQLSCATNLTGLVGVSMAGKAYFENHLDLVKHLTTNLSIGPVGTAEVAGDALCKTPLLRTARFASHQLRNMVAVGITGPQSVRLWMRTDIPGMHELKIFGDSRGTRSTKIMIPAGTPGDNTIAITYPQSSNDPPLDPRRKYRYRVVRTSDGQSLGEGSFETSPVRDGDTPPKVVIAAMSCHQPFTSQGTIAPESARMLRLLPQILRENNVKFVLLTGDQIYSDYPGVFSLFTNPYLIRRVVPGKTSIYECTADEVRRVYDMRYRIFRSMPPIREMYANYPCYPAMDDHEIMDDWGSLPEHSGPLYPHIWLGARRAYRDYQASSVLPTTNKLPRSFHYHFSYGNIGVFVMDIRSERSAVVPSQLLSVAQLDDLRQYLRNNGDKKVLLIVASVPVVHLPEWLAEHGHKITGPKVDFLDQWSHPKNLPARNAFLSLLHEHQQAHPKQRIAIVSGDVHIASAFSINWRHGNKPRLYQFTSSAISNLFQGWEADLSRLGPKFLSSIDCPKTGLGRECSGEVGLLPAVKEAASRNPFSGLNLGFIEVQRYKDVSDLKFKLIGYHPKEERPVTYFESGWLN